MLALAPLHAPRPAGHGTAAGPDHSAAEQGSFVFVPVSVWVGTVLPIAGCSALFGVWQTLLSAVEGMLLYSSEGWKFPAAACLPSSQPRS